MAQKLKDRKAKVLRTNPDGGTNGRGVYTQENVLAGKGTGRNSKTGGAG